MSIVPKETIEVIAQSVGISNLSPDVALALAPDVEYRLREIMQEAMKCMRHSRRTTLTTDDVDSALSLRNVEPVYGFASGDPLRFKRAVGHKDLFYIDDKDVEFKDIIEAPLPKAPLDTAVTVHWLAIEGVQPKIPENASVDGLAAPPESKPEQTKEEVLPVDIKLPVKHILSRELQLYFDKITELVVGGSESPLFKEALASLSTDSGLHPLVPYFTHFIADEVVRSLNDFRLLFALMRVVRSLLLNPHIHIEPYLHQLMPSIITCLVARRLGNKFADNHWELRDFTANMVASICKRFGHAYHNLQPRVTRTLLHAFLDPTKSLTQHYGAIQGLAALGTGVIRLLILPNLEVYLQMLEPEMQLETQNNEIKRHEAYRVYGALLQAAGKCLSERLKLFPCLLSPPSYAFWKTNKGKVSTTMPNKRKATTDFSSLQVKKVASESILMSSQAESLSHATQDAFSSASSGGSAVVRASSLPNGTSSRGQRQDKVDAAHDVQKRTLNSTQVLMKEDVDAGNLLSSLSELFGEAILSFVQSSEMMIFL
ncbi:transcription initiation factor TFIID subunit 6 [Nymphaea colorata]|nr:transcription initiation factor TFIID subunit 6 [Nymphaea colorata]